MKTQFTNNVKQVWNKIKRVGREKSKPNIYSDSVILTYIHSLRSTQEFESTKDSASLVGGGKPLQHLFLRAQKANRYTLFLLAQQENHYTTYFYRLNKQTEPLVSVGSTRKLFTFSFLRLISNYSCFSTVQQENISTLSKQPWLIQNQC